jgi:hypothetical protein
MPIKAIIEALYSKRDRNGNCYWAMRYTDVASGRQVQASISGGESNIYAIARSMGFESGEAHFSVSELGIREFNRMTKGWQYAGCSPDDLAKFVRSTLRIMSMA